MTADNLCVMLEDMLKETAAKKIKWRIEMATSEYRKQESKPVVKADEKDWTVDECYVAYSCEFRGNEFSMITYENMERSGELVRTTNLVFLPPVAMRIFRLDELAPYALETSAVLVEKVHRLWETLMNMYRADSGSVGLTVREIEVKDDSANQQD